MPTDPTPPQRTHWEGCYRDPAHHECAVAEVERLREAALRGSMVGVMSDYVAMDLCDFADALFHAPSRDDVLKVYRKMHDRYSKLGNDNQRLRAQLDAALELRERAREVCEVHLPCGTRRWLDTAIAAFDAATAERGEGA